MHAVAVDTGWDVRVALVDERRTVRALLIEIVDL
jgi:hypothetical protein